MQDQNQPTLQPFTRPSARSASAMPVQRGNYGIPPRHQTPPTTQPTVVGAPATQQATRPPTSARRTMDVTAPLRPTPPVATPSVTPEPPLVATVNEQISVVPQSPRQPLFTNTPLIEESARVTARKNHRDWLPKIRLALLIVGAVLLLGGTVRYITAGSTSGHVIAVGAIAANDGNTMTIQYTADDGRLHKFVTDSNEELIPGSAVQVAYRSGAADNSVKQVAPIDTAKSLGTALVMGGLFLVVAGAVISFMLRKPQSSANHSLAQPVTSAV